MISEADRPDGQLCLREIRTCYDEPPGAAGRRIRGIGVHLQPEWLFMMGRNTHLRFFGFGMGRYELCAATGSEDFLSGLPLRVQLPITGGNLVGGVQDGMVKNGLDIWFG